MTPDAFKPYWDTTYPLCPPAGSRLRQAFAPRWLRIHTLPQSQRYAQGEEDHRAILRRHNAALTDTLGRGQPCVWVATGYAETATPAVLEPLRWHVGLADPLLRQVADAAVSHVLCVSTGRQSVYAPYDGGGDLILRSPSARDAMRHRYADGLSSHPSGL